MRPTELRREYMDTPEALYEFAAKVERLRAEKLSTQAIARRLGVPPATLYERLRRAREGAA